MKTKFTFFALLSLISLKIFAQCPDDVAINNITLPTCGNNNGKFTVMVTPAQTPALYESSIDGGVTWFQHTNGNSNITYSGKAAGLYNLQVRKIGTTALCNNKNFILRSDYKSSFTATPTSATACNNTDGRIVLSGIAGTDSLSWISAINPTYVVASSLTSFTIPNLKPGIYYVIVKNPANRYCFSTKTITVGNSGTACPAPTLCGNAQGPNNFPNGTFGAGVAPDGPALPDGETTYGYSQLASGSPDDGFYAIANTTDFNGSSTAGGNVFGVWALTTDHTGDPNGYMMVVNASYDQDVVTEKTLTGLCPNKTYQFSAYVKNLLPNTPPSTTYIEPNLTFLIDGVGLYNTGNISGSGWINVGFTFKSSGTTAKFSIRNNNPGGNGNDWAIDDIYVGTCVPTIAMQPIIATCANPPTQATAKITDVSRLYSSYQWQLNKNDGNGYLNEGPLVTTTFSASNDYTAVVALPNPITIANNGWKYRIIVGTSTTDLTSTDCSYTGTQTLIIQDCGIILPIKLLSIKAELNNNKGDVYWEVADQINVHHYELEKSTDGKNFSYVTTVAVSNVGSTIHYMAEDPNINNGVNYYRIKVIDNDFKYAYSQVVTLALKGKTNELKIFPNPVNDRLFIWLPAETKINTAMIIDAAGRIVQQKIFTSNNSNVSDMELRNLPGGFYTIRIITNNEQVTNLRFIKKQ